MTQTLTSEITAAVLIPDLLRSNPAARPVLDRYGLKGCGGPNGPHETLGYFAKAHGVPIDRLLTELNAPPAPPPPEPPPVRLSADGIYRPFFLGGIATILTLGAVWGAYLLIRIAVAGRFTAVGIHEVNAHGHAQIFGWVGLFVMGFAYQAFPRFKHTALRYPGLAWLSFGLMIVGVVTRAILEPIADGFDGVAVGAVAASTVEVVAVGLFVGILAATWRASGKPFEVYDAYIASALAWFFAQAVFEAVYTAALFRAGPGELVPLVATWQGALRDFQIHGFATLMILGVSQRLLPYMFDFPAGSRRLGRVALIGLNLAVLGEATGLVLMRLHSPAWAGLWYLSVLTFAGFVAALVWNWKVFRRPGEPDRSLKFLRAAYLWLLISLGMLVALPVYQFALLPVLNPQADAVRTGFSHAYYGATRHAITVGFVSLMIVGVASKVVPILRGAVPNRLPTLWAPFVLINVGCTLRVVGQTATDWAGEFFPLAGVSGVLEVTGLAIWGAHLAALMLRRPAWEESPDDRGPRPITGGDSVTHVLDRHPDLLPLFLEFGFRPLANPILRRTARGVTINRACRFAGVDRDTFLAALNAKVFPRSTAVRSLPVLSPIGQSAG